MPKLEDKIPLIVADRATWRAGHLFNPNDWQDASRGIVQSCWTEFSTLIYCRDQIAELCRKRHSVCASQIRSIEQQWQMAHFEFSRLIIFAEVPDLHLRIEALLSGIKTLLDLLVQLLTSQGIVSASIHGFHEYGERVLKALTNNAVKSKSREAKRLGDLIRTHKARWMDEAIAARDVLIHPIQGQSQLMFHLQFAERSGGIVCTSIKPPAISSTPIEEYADRVVSNFESFIPKFFKSVRT